MPAEIQQLMEDPMFWALSIAFDIVFYGSIFNSITKKRGTRAQ